MASPRTLLLSIVAVAVVCSVFSVTDAVCTVDEGCARVAHAVGSCGPSGACQYTCDPNYKDCDNDMSNGCEADTTSDVDHCGDCRQSCPAPYNAKRSCEFGTCVISSGTSAFGI